MIKNFLKQNQNGIGLIETIAALGIAVIVITSLVSLSVFTLRASTRSKLMLQGSKLASNELELIRAYRDTRTAWSGSAGSFLTVVYSCRPPNPPMPATFCNVSNTLAVTSGEKTVGSGINAINVGFYVTDINGAALTSSSTVQVVRVTVRTSWNIGGTPHYSYIYTDLSNWRNL